MSLRPFSLFTGETLDADLSSLFENFTFEISDEISSDVVAELQADALETIESDVLEMTFEAEPFDGVIGPVQRFQIDAESGTITLANGVTIDYDVDHAATVVEEIETTLTELTTDVDTPVVDSLLDLLGSEEPVTREDIGAAVEEVFEGEAFDGVIGTVQRFEIDPETGTATLANGEKIETAFDGLELSESARAAFEANATFYTLDGDTFDILSVDTSLEGSQSLEGVDFEFNSVTLRDAAQEAFEANTVAYDLDIDALNDTVTSIRPLGDRLLDIWESVQDGEFTFEGTPLDGSALGLIQVMDVDLIG